MAQRNAVIKKSERADAALLVLMEQVLEQFLRRLDVVDYPRQDPYERRISSPCYHLYPYSGGAFANRPKPRQFRVGWQSASDPLRHPLLDPPIELALGVVAELHHEACQPSAADLLAAADLI